jgi:hypothetical protein
MADPLHYIKTKHSLRKKEKIHVIKNCIINKIRNDMDITKLRPNGQIENELILFVCSCLEELVKKKYGIDKKAFVVEILNALFGMVLNPMEIIQVESQIEFAYENELIKKVDINYKIKMVLWDWIKRKFL